MESDEERILSKQRSHLIRLFAMLVFSFTFEAVRTIHVFCFVISSVDIHSLRV